MIELALSRGASDYAWNSSTVIGLFCGGGISLVVFMAWEHRVGDGAMIPASVVRRREVWSASLYLGFFSGALLCFSYYMPIYFQAVKGAPALMSGVYMLSGILPQLVMAIMSGVLSKYLIGSTDSTILMTNIHSWKNGLLSTVGISQCCGYACWCRLNDNHNGESDGGPVGHISVCRRIGSRLWHANSETPPFTFKYHKSYLLILSPN
jgi:hypothetical protein